jgi:hypothetical protein
MGSVYNEADLIGMTALTVLQPWAWAIMDGRKRVENRTWRTSHRGPLLIHAGKGRGWLTESRKLPDGSFYPHDLQFGVLLGIVQVVDCVPVAQIAHDPFASGPWCWVLEKPQKLERPIACSGNQMLWTYQGTTPKNR